MPTVRHNIAQYSKRLISKTKKKVDYAQLLFGLSSILPVGILVIALQPVRASS